MNKKINGATEDKSNSVALRSISLNYITLHYVTLHYIILRASHTWTTNGYSKWSEFSFMRPTKNVVTIFGGPLTFRKAAINTVYVFWPFPFVAWTVRLTLSTDPRLLRSWFADGLEFTVTSPVLLLIVNLEKNILISRKIRAWGKLTKRDIDSCSSLLLYHLCKVFIIDNHRVQRSNYSLWWQNNAITSALLGSKAASDSTLKQLTLAGYQILVLFFFYFLTDCRQKLYDLYRDYVKIFI